MLGGHAVKLSSCAAIAGPAGQDKVPHPIHHDAALYPLQCMREEVINVRERLLIDRGNRCRAVEALALQIAVQRVAAGRDRCASELFV